MSYKEMSYKLKTTNSSFFKKSISTAYSIQCWASADMDSALEPTTRWVSKSLITFHFHNRTTHYDSLRPERVHSRWSSDAQDARRSERRFGSASLDLRPRKLAVLSLRNRLPYRAKTGLSIRASHQTPCPARSQRCALRSEHRSSQVLAESDHAGLEYRMGGEEGGIEVLEIVQF